MSPYKKVFYKFLTIAIICLDSLARNLDTRLIVITEIGRSDKTLGCCTVVKDTYDPMLFFLLNDLEYIVLSKMNAK